MEFKKLRNIYNCDVKIEHNIGADWIMDYYHFHNVYEVYLALTPGAEIWVRDQQFILKANDLLLLSTNDLHRSIINDKKNYERYIFYFNPLYASAMNTSQTNLLECFTGGRTGFSSRLQLEDSQARELVSMFGKLSVLVNNTSYAADVRTRIQVTEILIYINEIFHMKKTVFDSSIVEHSNYRTIKPVMDFVNTHYQQDINTDSVSRLFNLDRHQLNTLFRAVTGLPFHQYLVNIRIIKARELLEGGNITITQACYESGFNDYAHFIRTFKTMVGKPPGAYSKECILRKE